MIVREGHRKSVLTEEWSRGEIRVLSLDMDMGDSVTYQDRLVDLGTRWHVRSNLDIGGMRLTMGQANT